MKVINELIDKLERIQKECKSQNNKNKLGKIRRAISSMNEMMIRMYALSSILHSEKEVDWYYDKFKEEKKNLKR